MVAALGATMNGADDRVSPRATGPGPGRVARADPGAPGSAQRALIGACGAFVAAEFAFVTVDRSAIEPAAEAGDRRAAGTLTALRSLSTQLSGAQLGITITNLVIGFLAEPAIASLIQGPVRAAGCLRAPSVHT